MFIRRKVVIKMRNVYIITCLSEGKLFINCGMYISSRVHYKENCFKVAEYIYHYIFIKTKVVLKLQNVYVITCSSGEKSQGKLF